MANTLGVYNPIFYAQEALTQLEEVMGMANRVYRTFEDERRGFNRGDTISIRRPSTFTAQDAPSSAQDIASQSVDIKLKYWREVKFTLTDKELSFTTERIVDDHIRPAARALASDVDQKLHGLALDVPHQHVMAVNSTNLAQVSDITALRQILFDNKVPLVDPAMMHLVVGGAVENELLALEAFAQSQGAGEAGVNTQITGSLGRRYGMNIHANQNVPSFTAGSATDTGSDAAIDGSGSPVPAGTVEITIDGSNLTGDLNKGDIVEFDGIDQPYVVLEDKSAAGNAFTNVKVGVPGRGAGGTQSSPSAGLLTDIPDNTAVTFKQNSAVELGIGFHRNAFGLVVAPLSELGDGAGARIATIQDPFTNLSVRSRVYYDGDTSAVNVALDILYGVTTLDANLAARLVNPD